MSELKIFKNIQFSMDYGFFRNIVGSFIDEKELALDQRTVSKGYDISKMSNPDQIIENLGDSNYDDESYHTYLTPEMQSYIPNSPVSINQNASLTDLWRDQKSYLDKILRKH